MYIYRTNEIGNETSSILYEDGFVCLLPDSLLLFNFMWPSGKEYRIGYRSIEQIKIVRISGLRGNLIVSGPLFELALCHDHGTSRGEFKKHGLKSCILAQDQKKKFPFVFVCKNPEKVLSLIHERIQSQ